MRARVRWEGKVVQCAFGAMLTLDNPHLKVPMRSRHVGFRGYSGHATHCSETHSHNSAVPKNHPSASGENRVGVPTHLTAPRRDTLVVVVTLLALHGLAAAA